MAVAGFSEDELKVDVKEQILNIKGEKKAEEKERQFLHRGIATRAFERRFQLADHVEVKGANLKDGLLHLDLVRNVPERLKPRTIAIGNGKAQAQSRPASNAAWIVVSRSGRPRKRRPLFYAGSASNSRCTRRRASTPATRRR